uniref:hypothetical protein n=1 Tax=Mitsuokella multacida TaxID=52226 RepID=UPI0040271463
QKAIIHKRSFSLPRGALGILFLTPHFANATQINRADKISLICSIYDISALILCANQRAR